MLVKWNQKINKKPQEKDCERLTAPEEVVVAGVKEHEMRNK